MAKHAARAASMVAVVAALSGFTLAPDLTGVWKGQITDPMGIPHDATFHLKSTGDTLTGTLLIEEEPPQVHEILHGSIKGDSVYFEISVPGPDGKQTLTFRARVSGNQMQGTATAPEGEKFPFTVARRSGDSPTPTATTTSQRRAAKATGRAGSHPGRVRQA